MTAIEDQELKKHKEKVFGAENTPFSNSDKIWGHHKVDTSGADMVISTYQLLDSDIQNNRVSLGEVGFDDIIIDEATSVVAQEKFRSPDNNEKFFGGYKPAKRFEDILNETMDDSRYIALTALPGRKLDPIQEFLGASLIRPDQKNLTESMADITYRTHEFAENTQERNVFNKDVGLVQHRLASIEKTVADFRKELKGKVTRSDSNVGDQISVYAYANSDNDEFREPAVKALSYEHKGQMIHEGALGVIADQFDNPLPQDYTDPKIEGLQVLSNHWQEKGENYVVFASHRSTAEYLNNLTEGSTAIVDGDMSEEHNEEVLEQFGDTYDGIVMTYGYGSEGIDLPQGDRIVHMTDNLDPELKQSATGRAKRGKDITEHTLLYDFETQNDYDSSDFVPDDGLQSTPTTRAYLTHMLDTQTPWEDIIRNEKAKEATRQNDHLLNKPPKGTN